MYQLMDGKVYMRSGDEVRSVGAAEATECLAREVAAEQRERMAQLKRRIARARLVLGKEHEQERAAV